MSAKPLRIGIYVQTACSNQLTGIGRHVVALVDALRQVDPVNEYFLYYATSGRADEPRLQIEASERIHVRPLWFPRNWQFHHPALWWDWRLPLALKWDRIDVFHGPNHYLPKGGRRPGIVTIHDLAYFKMAVHGSERDEALRTLTRKALDRAAGVIALSQNTRADLLELGVPDSRIHVIYGGGNVSPEEQIRYERLDEMRSRLKIPDRYIFYVGAFQPRKNVPFLLRAFAEWKRRVGGPQKLVLAGPKENASEGINALVQELGLSDDVIVTGFVADWELPLLYKGADLFVLPSRYEGFTLVTIEAMAYGLPVISTQCSSIQEGTGDAAILVPVDDVAALAEAIETVLGQESRRMKMIADGRLRAQRFTWTACAAQTVELYQSMRTSS